MKKTDSQDKLFVDNIGKVEPINLSEMREEKIKKINKYE